MFLGMLITAAAINTVCNGQFIAAPLNTATTAGNNVTLHCSTNSTVQWTLLKVTKDTKGIVHHATHGGSTNLFIQSTTSTDAGQYSCIDLATTLANSAELIVVDAEPHCTPSLLENGGIVTLKCSITYSGRWAPVARWQHLDSSDPDVEENFAHSETYVHKRQLNFSHEIPAMTMNSSTEYRCTITFSLTNKPNETTANNTPEYQYMFTWTNHLTATTVSTDEKPGPEKMLFIYMLIGVTCGSILLLIINVLAVVMCRMRHPAVAAVAVKPESTPDLLQPGSTLSSNRTDTELRDIRTDDSASAIMYQNTSEAETAINGEQYAELESSSGRSRSRAAAAAAAGVRRHDNNNTAIYVTIDHTQHGSRTPRSVSASSLSSRRR